MNIDMHLTFRETLENNVQERLGITFELAKEIVNDCINKGYEPKDFEGALGDIPKNATFDSWDMEMPKLIKQYIRLFKQMWEPFANDIEKGFVTKKQAKRKYFNNANYQDVTAYYLCHYPDSNYSELKHVIENSKWCPAELLDTVLRETRCVFIREEYNHNCYANDDFCSDLDEDLSF